MDKRNTYSKVLSGPNGINCPCCCVGTKKYAKVTNARGKRRKARLVLKSDVAGE